MSTTIQPFDNRDGFTRINNYVLDYIMPSLPPNAWKVLCFVLRKTKGWGKDTERLSYPIIQNGTGIKSTATLSAALKELVQLDYIIIEKGGQFDAFTYSLNTDLTIDVGAALPALDSEGQPTSESKATLEIEAVPTLEIKVRSTSVSKGNKKKVFKETLKKELHCADTAQRPPAPSPIIEPDPEPEQQTTQENQETLFVCESPPTPPHREAPPAPRKRAKPPAHPGTRPILDAYTLAKERLEPGAVIHYAAEGVAARQLAEKGWTPESVVECFELMKRDGWWKEKSLRLASVASQIGAKLNGRRVDDYDPSKDKWYQGPYDGPAYDLDTIEITF
jgi:phage replication O-like protein O